LRSIKERKRRGRGEEEERKRRGRGEEEEETWWQKV